MLTTSSGPSPVWLWPPAFTPAPRSPRTAQRLRCLLRGRAHRRGCIDSGMDGVGDEGKPYAGSAAAGHAPRRGGRRRCRLNAASGRAGAMPQLRTYRRSWQHHPDSPTALARTGAGTRYMERVNPGTDEFWRCLRSCARAVRRAPRHGDRSWWAAGPRPAGARSGPGRESVAAVQPDEPGQGEHLPPLQPGGGTLEQDDFLVAAGPDWLH